MWGTSNTCNIWNEASNLHLIIGSDCVQLYNYLVMAIIMNQLKVTAIALLVHRPRKGRTPRAYTEGTHTHSTKLMLDLNCVVPFARFQFSRTSQPNYAIIANIIEVAKRPSLASDSPMCWTDPVSDTSNMANSEIQGLLFIRTRNKVNLVNLFGLKRDDSTFAI